VKKLEAEMIEFKGRMVGLLALLEQRNSRRSARGSLEVAAKT
jgi:hypothetical protein